MKRGYLSYLEENNSSLLIKRGEEIIYKDYGFGIRPMYNLINKNIAFNESDILIDKIIGSTCARFIVENLNINNINAYIISKEAYDILALAGKKVEYDIILEEILNRDKSDLCPVEKISKKSLSYEQLYENVTLFLNSSRKNNDSFSIDVIGMYGPYPSREGGCSSYLVRYKDKNILLDMGCGSLINLQKIIKLEDIDMIILSHLHYDHISDIFSYKYFLESRGKKIIVYAPPSPVDVVRSLDSKAFEIREINEDLTFTFGNLDFSFIKTKHPFLNYGIKITNGIKTFFYSGDASYSEEIGEFIRDIDVALLDSAFLRDISEEKLEIHMSAYQCSLLAKKYSVKKLFLTHLNPFIKEEDYLKECVMGVDIKACKALMKIKL